jgi:hypothetical protein
VLTQQACHQLLLLVLAPALVLVLKSQHGAKAACTAGLLVTTGRCLAAAAAAPANTLPAAARLALLKLSTSIASQTVKYVLVPIALVLRRTLQG